MEQKGECSIALVPKGNQRDVSVDPHLREEKLATLLP